MGTPKGKVNGYPLYIPHGHYKRPVRWLLVPASCTVTSDEYKAADAVTGQKKVIEKHTFIGFVPFTAPRT